VNTKIILVTKFFLIFFGFLLFYQNYQKISIDKKNQVELKTINKFENKKSIAMTYNSENNEESNIENIENIEKTIVIVKKNQTFIKIIENFFPKELHYKLIDTIQKEYNLRQLKVGQKIEFYKNLDTNKFEKIIIPIKKDIDLEIVVNKEINIEKKELKTLKEIYSKEYSIQNSLYSDGKRNNIPLAILTDLIRLYSFDLDFQRDIKKDTKVVISYESFYIEEKKQTYFGDINYALIQIGKNELEYFKFVTDDGYLDYFNRKGENVKKALLKTPLDGAKLSSGFGMRKHPISGFNKMHKGIDFAAPKGTPIYAGGNGVIEFVGRNGGYGKYIRIRHNNNYKTAYAHLSGYKSGISKGVRVNQGDVIGFVGSTGISTGPHLHYEIIYNNKQINPLNLKLPSGKKLKGNELERFLKEIKITYANHLNLLYE
tara:strand:- start:1814 stop:3100 length:1287 start_codon:yes stop_codon:yes gene_type:complete